MPTATSPTATPFYLSLFLARLADQILLFMVPLVVYQHTQSTSLTGWAFFVESFARFGSYPICGILSDRHPPLELLRKSQTWRAVVSACGVLLWVLPYVAPKLLPGHSDIVVLVIISAVCGILTTQGVMGREVLLPLAFDSKNGLQRIVAQTQIADQTGMVAGPALAGLALSVLPWQGVMVVTAVLFVLADLSLAWWQRSAVIRPRHDSEDAQDWWPSMRTALGHLWHVKGLKVATILTSGITLILGITQATAAAMYMGWLQQTPSQYAHLQTGGALATIAVLLWLARSQWRGHAAGMLAYTMMWIGSLLTLLVPHPWVYTAGFLLVVGFDKMYGVYNRMQRQRLVPAQDLGKTTGVLVLLNNLSQPLSGLLVGLFAQGADARPLIACVTAWSAALGMLWWWQRKV